MPGHRKPNRPSPRWAERAARASTPDDQLTVAYDRLRSVIAHLRRRQRDESARAQDRARADRLATAAAGVLNEICDRAEGGHA